MKIIYTTCFLAILSLCAFAQHPSIGGYNIYYGQLHNHTAVSDGKGTPAQAYSYAKNTAKLDFFSIADHSDNSGSISSSEWTDTKNQANAINQDGVFTAFYGFEWGSSTYGDLSVINADDLCTTASTSTFSALKTWLTARPNAVAFFNHPGRDGFSKEYDKFATTPCDNVVGIELWNSTDGFSEYYYNDGFYTNDNNRGYYDEALTRGWKIGAGGSGDNHDATWGTAQDYRLAILSNNLTRADLLAAMKARRFYSTLDKNLALSFKINDQEMGSTVGAGTYNLQVQASDGNGESFTQVVIYDKNHNILKTWSLNTANVNVSMSITTVNGDYYYAKVKQSDGNEAISSPIWISGGTNPTPPAAPTNLTATVASCNQINLTWSDNSTNESNFKVERSTDGTNWSVLATTAANTTSYSNSGLSESTRYYYRVMAANTAGNSTYAGPVNATTTVCGNTSTITYQAETATLSQAVTESTHTGYHGASYVNYNNSVGSYVEWTVTAPSAQTASMFIRYANKGPEDRAMDIYVNGNKVISGLSFPATGAWTTWANTNFSVALTAGNNTVRATATVATGGPNVDELSVTTTNTPVTPPLAPSNLTAVAVSSSQINLGWTDNSSNESNFKIERSADGTTWSALATAAANSTSYPDAGLTPNTLYYYRVYAINAGGNSANSNSASATTSNTTTLTNLALNKTVVYSSQPQPENPASAAVDGNTSTRWSASVYPQWIEVDLGAAYNISKTELVCYGDRAYKFKVEAKPSSTGAYTQIVNRTSNTTPGTIAAPIVDNFAAISARFVKLTVTGCTGYTGTWASIIEFRVFGNASAAKSGPSLKNEETGTFTISPNPVNYSSIINYTLANDAYTQIKVYNPNGLVVASLVDRNQTAGEHSFSWDASSLKNGVYYVRFIAGNATETTKIIKQ